MKGTNTKKSYILMVAAATAVMMMAAGPIAFSSYASAAAATPPSVVHVLGKGKIVCADGTRINSVNLDLKAESYDGVTYGYFDMNKYKQGLDQYGELYRGKITPDGYKLTGIEDFSMCGGSAVPTTVLIKGDCGFTVDVIFTAANGDKGKFTGNAACVA